MSLFQNVVNPVTNQVALHLTRLMTHHHNAVGHQSASLVTSPDAFPLLSEDVDALHTLSALYSDSLQGVDWQGFARAAQELRLFEDDFTVTPMFSEQYGLHVVRTLSVYPLVGPLVQAQRAGMVRLQDRAETCRNWMVSILSTLPTSTDQLPTVPTFSRQRLRRLMVRTRARRHVPV